MSNTNLPNTEWARADIGVADTPIEQTPVQDLEGFPPSQCIVIRLTNQDIMYVPLET